MASEVTGFDMAVPKARNQDERRDKKKDPTVFSKEAEGLVSLRRLLSDYFSFC
ncbi:MAG: hypothetical protein JO119_10055 [Acidobacteria bacterium]|nr:hypothetical protein [Acidobacteriota bacterium]